MADIPPVEQDPGSREPYRGPAQQFPPERARHGQFTIEDMTPPTASADAGPEPNAPGLPNRPQLADEIAQIVLRSIDQETQGMKALVGAILEAVGPLVDPDSDQGAMLRRAAQQLGISLPDDGDRPARRTIRRMGEGAPVDDPNYHAVGEDRSASSGYRAMGESGGDNARQRPRVPVDQNKDPSIFDNSEVTREILAWLDRNYPPQEDVFEVLGEPGLLLQVTGMGYEKTSASADWRKMDIDELLEDVNGSVQLRSDFRYYREFIDGSDPYPWYGIIPTWDYTRARNE